MLSRRLGAERLDRRRLLRLFQPYRWRLSSVLALILISAALGMVSPFLLRAVLDQAIPEAEHRAPGRPGGRDDRDRGRHRRARRRPDAALEHGRTAGHARPADAGVPPPSAALAGLLHPHPDRGDPVADRQRHRRRAERGHQHRDLDRLQRDHGAGGGGGDVPARLAPGAVRARAAAVLRLADAAGRRGAAADHRRAPGTAGRHLGADRGVAVGLGDPARQDDGALGRAGGALRARVGGARRARGALADGRAMADGLGADRVRRDARARLPVRRAQHRRRRPRDHDRHPGRLHHPPDADVLPDPVAALGQRRRAELAGAVRAGVRLSRRAGRDPGAPRRAPHPGERGPRPGELRGRRLSLRARGRLDPARGRSRGSSRAPPSPWSARPGPARPRSRTCWRAFTTRRRAR